MFGRNKKVNSTRIETLVGKNTKISGNLSFTGGLHVEGEVEGSVQAGDEFSVLILSESGLIKGDVHVPNMILNGSVEGDVYASDHVELAPQARITGNVYYNLIEMSMGATLNGNLIHQEGGKPKLEHLVEPDTPMDKESESAKANTPQEDVKGSSDPSDSKTGTTRRNGKTTAAAGNS
jgi:cytoskeletal protein CcmA (bactofilin family)